MKGTRTIVCVGGRCSSWGRKWSRHLYSGNEDCLRCGMNRKEQWDEDKSSGLVSGVYKPLMPVPEKQQRKSRSKKLMYCAVGDYGIENAFETKSKCLRWIKDQNEEYDYEDYYSVITYTKEQLDDLPED